jgi:tetratricopeptide (TPR) repeat protein
MAQTAEFMTRRWPGTPAAETAQRVLVAYAIRTGRIDEAKDLFDQVPAAARPALEAQLGNALWAKYLQKTQLAGAGKPVDEETTKLRAEAIKYMQAGFDAAKKSGQASEVTATSGLYLAQMLLAEGKFDEATKLLETPKVGPLTMVRDGSSAALRPEFVIETYKAALRAFVGATPPKIDAAIAAMQGLEAAVGANGGAQGDQLMRIYVALAKGLNEQLVKLREAGQMKEVAELSSAFGKFLNHVSAEDADASWATRYWIAQTFFSMGEGLRAAGTSPTEATAYFTKARDAFAKLAAEAEKDPSALPSPVARLAVEKQLGESFRELGEYQKALDAFSNVLADQEAQLTVQQAAARTYQRWGQTGGGVKKLERAIFGGYLLKSTNKNRIWGWLKLAQVAERAGRSDPKYQDLFFEARLEAARCRYLIGTKTQGNEREKNFTTAKQSIRSMIQLYPDLGGERWREEYENLLKQIQKASGDSPKGLAEFAALKK